MQIRTYTAPTLAEALASVREDLGPEAYVLATDQPERGPVRVVAALPDAAAPASPIGKAPELPESQAVEAEATAAAAPPVREPEPTSRDRRPLPTSLAQILARHGVPHAVAGQLLRGGGAGGSIGLRLHSALAASFDFAPLNIERTDGPLLLAGPPGGGKTVTAAKIAAAARFAGRDAHLITTDTWRAAGAEQLRRYAEALGVPCDEAGSGASLRQMIALAESDSVVVIDTPGLDLMNRQDRQALLDWSEAAETAPTLVLPGGLDAEESAEIACAFAGLGGGRLVATRLDCSRRLGNLLAAAHAGTLAFAAAGVAPRISGGLVALDADMLARCLISDERNPEALLDDPREGPPR